MRTGISDQALDLELNRHNALQFRTAARTTTNTPRPSPPSVTDWHSVSTSSVQRISQAHEITGIGTSSPTSPSRTHVPAPRSK